MSLVEIELILDSLYESNGVPSYSTSDRLLLFEILEHLFKKYVKGFLI